MLLHHTPLPKRELVLRELHLVRGHDLLSFRNIKGPCTCVDRESHIDCFLSTRRMLSFCSALRVNVYPGSASERSEAGNILLLSIYEMVRRGTNPCLECRVACINARRNQNLPPSPDSIMTVLAISIIELIVDSAGPFCHCSRGVLK